MYNLNFSIFRNIHICFLQKKTDFPPEPIYRLSGRLKVNTDNFLTVSHYNFSISCFEQKNFWCAFYFLLFGFEIIIYFGHLHFSNGFMFSDFNYIRFSLMNVNLYIGTTIISTFYGKKFETLICGNFITYL